MKKIVATIVMAILVLGAYSSAYAEESKTYGQVLHEIGLIQGDGGDIKEEKEITREEMTVLLVRVSGKSKEFEQFELPAAPTFKDVPANHWAYKYIEFAFREGLTKGVSDGQFGLSKKINYNQASLFLLRSLGYDGKDIDYNQAAAQIGEKYGLKLENRKVGKAYLKRGHVFELLAKSLAMKPAQNDKNQKIETIGLSDRNIKEFSGALLTARPFYDKSKMERYLKNEFIVTDLSGVTKQQILAEKDSYLLKAYEGAQGEEMAMKRFVETYLNSDYQAASLKEGLLKKIMDDEIDLRFETGNVRNYEYGLESNISSLSPVFYELDAEDAAATGRQAGDILFGVHVSSGYGRGYAGGKVNEVRRYADKDGLQVYAIFGTEEFTDYSGDGTEKFENLFYTAFTITPKGEVVECIGSSGYGTGYSFKNQKRYYPE